MIAHMRAALFVGAAVSLVGCGGYTNENTPVKVVTEDEMRSMHETNQRIAEQMQGFGSPQSRQQQSGAARGK